MRKKAIPSNPVDSISVNPSPTFLPVSTSFPDTLLSVIGSQQFSNT